MLRFPINGSFPWNKFQTISNDYYNYTESGGRGKKEARGTTPSSYIIYNQTWTLLGEVDLQNNPERFYYDHYSDIRKHSKNYSTCIKGLNKWVNILLSIRSQGSHYKKEYINMKWWKKERIL